MTWSLVVDPLFKHTKRYKSNMINAITLDGVNRLTGNIVFGGKFEKWPSLKVRKKEKTDEERKWTSDMEKRRNCWI